VTSGLNFTHPKRKNLTNMRPLTAVLVVWIPDDLLQFRTNADPPYRDARQVAMRVRWNRAAPWDFFKVTGLGV